MEKKISEMTNEEILRQQLELLAEDSKNSTGLELQSLTIAMSDAMHSMERVKAKEVIFTKSSVCNRCEELQKKQSRIVLEIEQSKRVQKKYAKIQTMCLIGLLINVIYGLIYFVRIL